MVNVSSILYRVRAYPALANCQLIEGIEIKSPLKLQPQMTRRSRQPVAPLHRCVLPSPREGETRAGKRRHCEAGMGAGTALGLRRLLHRLHRQWEKVPGKTACCSVAGRGKKRQSAGRGKQQSCQLLLQRCSCSKMACHGLLTSPSPSTSPLAACCCSLLVQHFPISHCDCSAGGRGRRRIAYCNFSHDYVALTLAYATSSAMQCSTEWKL